MAKTVFTINKSFLLTDSDNKAYKTTVEILERLKKLRVGTVVEVCNLQNPLNGPVDRLKTYYMVFDRFGMVMLIYVNLRNRLHSVIAKTELADFDRDHIKYDATVQFITKLHEIHGTLHVLNLDDGNKRSYVINKVGERMFVVDDDGKFAIYNAELQKINYRNLEGKKLQQNWVSLDEAVLQYALRVPKPLSERIAVCTEHGTVVFMI